MIKLKVTKKEIKNNFQNVFYCNYCQLADLLSYEMASYYTANAYGWRNDIYLINNTVIVTGYEPFGNREISTEICKKYEGMARNTKNKKITFEKMQEELRELIINLMDEVIE